MKKALLFLLLASGPVMAQDTEVKKAIAAFFEGMHVADTLKIKQVCSDKMILQTIKDRAEGVLLVNESTADFYRSVATLPKGMRIEERLLEYRIVSDGALAHAWTPYEFYINGQLSHAGVNSFTLFNNGSGWKIIHIIDTRHRRKP